MRPHFLLVATACLCACAPRQAVKPALEASHTVYERQWRPNHEVGGFDLTGKNAGQTVVFGPGPRLHEFRFLFPMSDVYMELWDPHGRVAKRVRLHPVDTGRKHWQAAWWMGREFKDGVVYRTFAYARGRRGERLDGLNEDVRHLSDERLNRDSPWPSGRSFAGSFVFKQDEPNPNLSDAWAQEMVKAQAR